MSRYILPGTPGAGKTAVLRLSEFNGHVVVEEAATDVIALDNALGHEEPWNARPFIDKIVTLQRHRQICTQAPETVAIFFDRSPLCTLALSRYLGFAPSHLLADEVDRVIRENVYEATVFFIRNQGFIHATATRRINFEDSLTFEQLTNRPIATSGSNSPTCPLGHCLMRATRPALAWPRIRWTVTIVDHPRASLKHR